MRGGGGGNNTEKNVLSQFVRNFFQVEALVPMHAQAFSFQPPRGILLLTFSAERPGNFRLRPSPPKRNEA
jgi:hypothetical protein